MTSPFVPPWREVPQGRIFISYRREDTQWAAGRLADSLSRYFGDHRVFRDIDGIGGGEDFGNVIHGTLGKADAAIILIGNRWIDAANETGQRRLDDPGDWVAQEVAMALEAGVPVYPVLVDDAPMPRADALPERLRAMARLNAISVSDNRWDADVERLARIVSLDIPSATERKLHGANLLVSLALAVSLIFTTAVLAWNILCRIARSARPPELLTAVCGAGNADAAKPCVIDWPLSLAQSGVPFLVIVPASAILFVVARLVEQQRRPYLLAAAWAGTIGTLLCFVLLSPIPDRFEPVSMYLGGTASGVTMFALMNLSGFRPK